MAFEKDILDDILDGKNTVEQIDFFHQRKTITKNKNGRKLSFNDYVKQQAQVTGKKPSQKHRKEQQNNKPKVKKTRRFDV